jgi:hypothetical protein
LFFSCNSFLAFAKSAKRSVRKVIFLKHPMEINDDKLRQIVRETLQELGPHADPALVQKVVREVLRQLQKHGRFTTNSGSTVKPLIPNAPTQRSAPEDY